MKESTERLVPGRVATVEERVVDAMHRYAYTVLGDFAAPSDRALEIGFGEGYGSAIVEPLVGEYVGVEVEAAAVEHARVTYGRPGAVFVLYDGTRLPFDDASFDVAFAFQVLEHVRDAPGFLAEARRVVRPGGRVLIVTPNRNHRLGDGERPWNRYHVREYTPGELEELVRSVFGTVELYGISGSETMNAIEKGRVQRARKLARIDRLGLRYHLPEGLDTRLRTYLRRRRSAEPAHDLTGIGVEHVRRVTHGIDEALDLLAVASRD